MEKYEHLQEVAELGLFVGDNEFLAMIVVEVTDMLAYLMEAAKATGVGAGTFHDLVDKIAAAARAMQAEEDKKNDN